VRGHRLRDALPALPVQRVQFQHAQQPAAVPAQPQSGVAAHAGEDAAAAAFAAAGGGGRGGDQRGDRGPPVVALAVLVEAPGGVLVEAVPQGNDVLGEEKQRPDVEYRA
ncbi:hypothetical protein VM98_37315, partial [Streptomyces rubellomurinus subsp. indigoferus]